MSDFSKRMSQVGQKLGMGFTLKGRGLSLEEVFSPTGMLPGLMKRADQLASLCFGYGLGATYEDVEKSLMGSRVVLDEFTPEVLRIVCIVDVLYELQKGSMDSSAIALDELLYD